ncbi:hypothetical protein D3C87_1361830 [compost metagenome]
MCDQDAGADALEQCRHGIHSHLVIQWPRIRHHLPEVLVQRFRILRELHAGIEVRPGAQAEHVEPALLVRFRGDPRSHRAAAGATPARLVDQVHGEAAAHKDCLEPFAAVGCGLPGLRELAKAVPHDQGQLSRIHGDLVHHARVVAMQRLPVRTGLAERIGTWALHDRTADREAALGLEHDRRRRVRRVCRMGRCACAKEGRADQRQDS